MRRLVFRAVRILMVGAMGVLPAAGQSAAQTGDATAWVPPRASDGRPSLEGVWEHNSATPLERPGRFADKPRLTDDELASLERRAGEVFTPESDAVFGDSVYLALLSETPAAVSPFPTGSYSHNWLPERTFEHRTSLIVDPPDGRLPQATAAGRRARAAWAARFLRPPDAVEDMTLTDRCISYGVPDLFAAYMSVYRIVQTPEYVAIQMEKIHDVRIIPLDGRPHLSTSVRHYLGDSRGRWDGDTLVVETTNFHPNGNPMGGLVRLSDANLRLVERFRRVAADTLEYTFTVDDPTMWTEPWTATLDWRAARGDLYEYACHEGNYSLSGMLTGARAEEAAAR